MKRRLLPQQSNGGRAGMVWVRACGCWLGWARVGVVARHGHSYGHGCPVMLAGDGSKQRLQVQQITGRGAETDEVACERAAASCRSRVRACARAQAGARLGAEIYDEQEAGQALVHVRELQTRRCVCAEETEEA